MPSILPFSTISLYRDARRKLTFIAVLLIDPGRTVLFLIAAPRFRDAVELTGKLVIPADYSKTQEM